MLTKSLWTALVVIILVGSITTAGEIVDEPEVVSIYARGKRLMRDGNWLEASKLFEMLCGRFSSSRNLDLFIFHRAKADYYFGDYSEAIAGFGFLVTHYTDSPERAHGYFFLANACYRRGNVDRAMTHYLDAYRLSNDAKLTSLVESSIESAVGNASSAKLGQADFENLPEGRKCRLIKKIVETLLRKDQVDWARRIASYCSEEIDFGGRLEYTPGVVDNEYEVAMVLPFSGEMQSFGDQIYNGAVIAAAIVQQDLGINLKLTAYDTRGEAIEAARVVGELSYSGTAFAIGPLTSDAALVASAALACGDLPLLIPAATESGLTALSGSSFQLSPNAELQGKTMAEYARSALGADSSVIITSTRPEHLRMTRAFVRRFEQLGGQIVAVEYYRPRDRDFGPHIRDVKAMVIGVEPDSTYFIDQTGDTLDFDGLAVDVDCLFMPGTAQQLKQLLAQLNFYNLTGHYLGTDGWGDRDVYKLGDKVTKAATFASPYLSVGRSAEYLKFAAAYDKRYGEQPQRLASLGYDATRLAAQAISRGGYNREGFVTKLMDMRYYEGCSGLISFGEIRENIEMPLYRILNEQAVSLDQIDPPEVPTPTEDEN